MGEKTILVWFRKDLRIHDNEILTEAVRKAELVVPVYCFDPRQFEMTSFQTRKTGRKRAAFLLESVANLQESLQRIGGDLIIRYGKPETILPELVVKYGVSEVYHHREVASEETRVSADVENALWKLKINLKHFIGHTLYHKEDLPFPINNIPDSFKTFRKKVERESSVRPRAVAPDLVRVPQSMESGKLPSLSDLGYDELDEQDHRSAMHFKGGESEALKRMQEYFWETDSLKNYKSSRNKLIGSSYSSKFSAWISLGCLSPREVYWEIKRYEQQRGSTDSAQALYLQLLWRDYFRFMFKKHGNKFFQKIGFKGAAPEESEHQQEFFELWKNAQTGVPFIDANIREMNTTGYLSNTGRQNVASYLVKDLKVNWLWGAAYLEEKLIDYCPANNWGNWAFIAGVGNDPKEYQSFNVLQQALDLDPQGDYVRIWLPELSGLPGALIHQPWKLSEEEVEKYQIGQYPRHPVSVPDYPAMK